MNILKFIVDVVVLLLKGVFMIAKFMITFFLMLVLSDD